ncbi:M24 family metallopeptidase, partial [Kineococcus glutinatus]|uniref:M24 family metallopeptidase n=1 Tax=Kineococcus glutinatus TaxID=1070872 RepID=UPI0031EBE137
RERVRAVLAAHGAARLVLRSTSALSWYLDGARTHVGLTAGPVVAVVVTPTTEEAVTRGDEAARLVAEELPGDLPVRVVPWHAALLRPEASRGVPGVLHEEDVAAELRAARAALLPAESARYRRLCADVAAVLADVAAVLSPGTSERRAAAELGRRLLDLGADPLVLLVGGAGRLAHRHALPTGAPLGERAVLTVCARRHGLVAAATRWVRFAAPAPGELDAEMRLLHVEADVLAATRPGRRLRDVLADVAAAYPRHGFAADEWERHHQGGPAGYDVDDPAPTATAADVVHAGQAFAWNPSAPGAKVRDTVLLGPAGAEVLTRDAGWPAVEVAGRLRPLVRQL